MIILGWLADKNGGKKRLFPEGTVQCRVTAGDDEVPARNHTGPD